MYERYINKKNGRRACPKRRSYRRKFPPVVAVVLPLGCLVISGILYAGIGIRYRDHFCPNTVINGMDVSGMNVSEVMTKIDADVKKYVLTIETRDGEEKIRGNDIGLRAEFDETLEEILEMQNPVAWGIHVLRQDDYEIKTMVSYDETKLTEVFHTLACLDPEQIVRPADSYLMYVKGSGYQIVPEVRGNELLEKAFYSEVKRAIRNLEKDISLENLELYREPQVLSDDEALKDKMEARTPYTDVTVTYRFGSRTEILDGSITSQWLSETEDGNVVIDKEMAAEYVRGLAQTYNTAYRPKELKTSYGSTVTITSGHYGWMIDQAAETEALVEILGSGQSQEREPVYSQKAASHDGPDYGDTYAELNLTAQHIFFYKNGTLLVESDFVSGNEAKGWSTPPGAFALTYKQKDAVLKGKNYATPVTYWMPFNGNIGMHDGYWRSSFGGTIYKKNGSHGCVNLPPAVAKTIFENIEGGMPVLCYHLDGTEKKEKTDTERTGAAAKTQETAASSGISRQEAIETESSTPESTTPESPAQESSESESPEPQPLPSETMPSETIPALNV